MAFEQIDFKSIDQKWQKLWEEENIFRVKGSLKKKKFYNLEMFPYPSAAGLHMGHALNYTIGDVYARFKRMSGFNVLYPMGYDAFGLPAENAAIKAGEHPRKYTEKSMANFIMQQKALGLSYDWSRKVVTSMPEYYRWNQWFFIKFFENGLVYRKKSSVNWCPKCNTVLANEQVHSGKCWRHEDTDVEVKQLEQWFIRTTKYADELVEKVKALEWPERIKLMQENWIGKSFGTEIIFKINGNDWPIFTTRPDTLFGVTFMVVSAQHPKLAELVTEEQKKDVEEFLKRIKSTTLKNATEEELDLLEKDGVFTGSYAVNPATGEKVPVYAGNFVIADYGSGMVMAVPAHDQRDFEFAKKYGIPIKYVIMPRIGEPKPGTEPRNTISAVVHRKKDNKFLVLKWKEFGWISPSIGGIEKGEDVGKAAEREVLEETGYQTKFVRTLGGKIESHFFAENKKVFRHRIDQPVLLELESETPAVVEKEEREKHDALWMTYDEAMKNITHEYNKTGFKIYMEGERAYTDEGVLTDSAEFSGSRSTDAIGEITAFLEKKGLGRKVVQFKLRDWLISRQRYWGTPIPMLYCDRCGIVPVPEKNLPVLLSEDVKFGEGNPLASSKSFVEVKCPKCKGKARRETDTMDTFFDSSWYFLRYCDNENRKKAFDSTKAGYWMPVDQYIGGAEHACMHLIYARFFVKALRDMKMLSFDEPFTRLFNQGMLHGSDGNKMSKSLGNVVNPIEMIDKYGADALRFNLMSLASPDKDSIWSDRGIESTYKFITSLFNHFSSLKIGKSSRKIESKVHSTIKEYTGDVENFRYNLAIIKLRALFEAIEKEPEISAKTASAFLKLLHPFCPHITEELWEKLGNKGFISLEKWPQYDEKKIDKKAEMADEFVSSTISDVRRVLELAKIGAPKKITIIISEEWRYHFIDSFKKKIAETRDFRQIMAHFAADEDMKQHMQDIQKMLPRLLSDDSKLPSVVLDQKTEKKSIASAEELLKSEFKAEIEIAVAEKSKEQKARQAMPGKPAIVVE